MLVLDAVGGLLLWVLVGGGWGLWNGESEGKRLFLNIF
jgi:hypothetical protein